MVRSDFNSTSQSNETIVHINIAEQIRHLKKIGYDGWMTIEAFGSPLPDLVAATKVWRPLFKDLFDVPTQGIQLMREGWAKA